MNFLSAIRTRQSGIALLLSFQIISATESYAFVPVQTVQCDERQVSTKRFRALVDDARRSGDTVPVLVWVQNCLWNPQLKGFVSQLWQMGMKTSTKKSDGVFSDPNFRLRLAQLFAIEIASGPEHDKQLKEIKQYVREYWTSADPLRQLYALMFYVKLESCELDDLQAIALREESVALIIIQSLILAMGPPAEPRVQAILRQWPRIGQNQEYVDLIKKQLIRLPDPTLAYVEGTCKKGSLLSIARD